MFSYSIKQIDKGFRIRTSCEYPDGEIIDVFILFTPRGLEISDLGETLRWLYMQQQNSSESYKKQINEILVNNKIKLRDGQLVRLMTNKEGPIHHGSTDYLYINKTNTTLEEFVNMCAYIAKRVA